MLMKIEYILAWEVNQALLTKTKSVSVCRLDFAHECRKIRDPGIESIAFLVVAPICASRLPIEKIKRVCVWFAGDVYRVWCFPFIVPEGERFDAEFEFVFDGGYLVVGDRIFDLVETFFAEQRLLPVRKLRVSASRVKGREHCISKAAVISVLDLDDCMLLGEELW